MEIVTFPVVLVDQFYFHMHQPIRVWLFEKIIFELDYHWASLSLHLKSFSFKITCILLRQVISLKKMVVLLAKVTILVSRFLICIPWILTSINKIGKNLSLNIV